MMEKEKKDSSFQTFRTQCFPHKYTNAKKETRHYYWLQSKANLVSLHFGLNPYLSHMHTVPKTWQLFFTFFPCILFIDFLRHICLKYSALWKNGQQWFSLQIFNFCGSCILDYYRALQLILWEICWFWFCVEEAGCFKKVWTVRLADDPHCEWDK